MAAAAGGGGGCKKNPVIPRESRWKAHKLSGRRGRVGCFAGQKKNEDFDRVSLRTAIGC